MSKIVLIVSRSNVVTYGKKTPENMNIKKTIKTKSQP